MAKDDDGIKPASLDQKNLTCSKQSYIAVIERSSPEFESRSSSSIKWKQLNEQLESAKSKMDEVKEENQRLRMYLDQILKDYRTLEIQYQDAVQKEAKTCPSTAPTHRDQTEEPELFALSLGRTSSGTVKDGRQKMAIDDKLDEGNEGLKLRLGCEFQIPKTLSLVEPRLNPSPDNSSEEVKERMKNVTDGGDDEILLQNPAKRARVSVRVRCDTPTMNDGCQWRKYGQKIAKGNPCPRAYYRCTVAPSCPVRKQVQRCAEDMSILITTYEGTHNHPLSVSATAMASTTSAAAAMLLSGPSTSTSGPSSSTTTTTTATTANLNGLNFYLSNNSRPNPFYLPNSSISSSPSCPTIILDLTSTSSSSFSSSSSSSNSSRLGHFRPQYPTTNFNFNPLESCPPLNNISWSNGLIPSSGTQPCNKSQFTSSLSFGENSNETFLQSYLRKNTLNPNQQTLAPEAIAAATKAIASDPSFRSALVAALSSVTGSGGTNNGTLGNQKIDKKSTQNINSSEAFPTLSSMRATPNAQNKSSSSTSFQSGGFAFVSPSFLLSNSKSESGSPADNNSDHII